MTGRLARLSLRVRLLLLGVTGVGVALAVGGILLYAALGVAVNRTMDEQTRTTAHEVAELVDAGPAPNPIPVPAGQIAQVVDRSNRVVSASRDADRLTSLLRPAEVRTGLEGHVVTVPGSRAALDAPVRAVVVRAGPARARLAVVVAQQTGAVANSQRLFRTTLLVTYPLLLALLALIAWHAMGWTLRPVEALRRGAERISGSNDEERLPVPEAADEIHALATTLNHMLDRLATARRRQRSFVADAAHELRNPLASLRTQLEVAQRLGEGTELFEDVLAEVNRLSSLAEDLLLLARTQESGPRGEPQRFAVRPVLQDVVEHLRGGRVPVLLSAGADDTSLTVFAYPEDLRRVLDNLVDNAVRHASAAVTVRAEAAGSWTRISVIDDGPGIAPSDRERVFDRFTRLDGARDRDAGGAGLGLAIVHDLVQRAGGTVTLGDADPGPLPGVRAVVTLPR